MEINLKGSLSRENHMDEASFSLFFKTNLTLVIFRLCSWKS